MRKLRPHSFGEKPRGPRRVHVAAFVLLAVLFVVLAVVLASAPHAAPDRTGQATTQVHHA